MAGLSTRAMVVLIGGSSTRKTQAAVELRECPCGLIAAWPGRYGRTAGPAARLADLSRPGRRYHAEDGTGTAQTRVERFGHGEVAGDDVDVRWQRRCRLGATGEGANRHAGADESARYLTVKAPHLDYATALAKGWPIATGVIEGACRHLVKDRMDMTGARWGPDGAEAILKLRALIATGDFEPYWHYHLRKEHERIHGAHDRASFVLAA